MLDPHGFRAWSLLAAAATFASACRGPLDPFTSGPGRATVAGVVTSSTGTSVAGTTIRIGCAGGSTLVNAVTDSSGRYLANLTSGADPFEGNSGILRCQFTEPATAPARVRLDTTLGFVRGPVLVAKQFVDIREP